jgi:microcystin degradation protein MlrC
MAERGQEAAFSLRRILAGQANPHVAHVKLPLAPASVALLTAKAPYGDLIDFGQRRQAELSAAIMNVSVFGNFIFSDVPENGISVVVTATRRFEAAMNLATEIADMAWSRRHEFVRDLTSMLDAVQITLDQDRQPVIFSEAGDNPGGGGSGRTTDLLSELITASAQDVFYGSFFDPELAEDAHRAGLGAMMTARFNRNRGTQVWEQWDEALEVEAEVVGLSDGDVVGRHGMLEGRRMHLGTSALLRIGGIHVVVISDRAQTSDPMFFEMFGLDIADAHTVIVKSRGHFRAGFDIWFSHERTFEIDTAGLTSPILDRWGFTRIPRPSYPFDQDTTWATEEAG